LDLGEGRQTKILKKNYRVGELLVSKPANNSSVAEDGKKKKGSEDGFLSLEIPETNRGEIKGLTQILPGGNK